MLYECNPFMLLRKTYSFKLHHVFTSSAKSFQFYKKIFTIYEFFFMDLHNYLELSGVKCADDRYVKQRRTPISAGTWMGSRSAIFVFSFHVS